MQDKNATKNTIFLNLPLLTSLNEKECQPFWNEHCSNIQSTLWLPKKEADHEIDTSIFWMNKITPNRSSILASLSVSLPHSSINSEKDPAKDAVVIASKKIRFYPNNKKAYQDALALYRRSYNLAIARYKENTYKDENGKVINLRPEIKEQVEREQREAGNAYNSLISDNGTLSAKRTFTAVCKKNKALKGSQSGFSQLHFKSRKGSRHSFSIDRFPKGKNPCVEALGKIYLTESVPNEAFGKSCIITCDKGRWFIQVQQHISLDTEIQGKVKCMAVDPGVRTFATCYSQEEVLVVGDNFAKEKLFPLMKRVDKLISQRQRLLNAIQGVKNDDLPLWASQWLAHYNNEINRLKCKKDDLVLDLHHRLAYELVKNYDVIFLPSFETKKMVSKKGNTRRRIRANTCRQMLDLNHYQFKLRLKWYARKYGKHVVDCNESYTSKTRSWDGSIDDKLGSSKTIKGDGFSVDRDINGARNILIKHLSKAA